MYGVLAILAAFAAWGAVHSATASLGAKARARRWLGARTADGWYRLAYNAFSILTFLPIMALVPLLPDQPLYALPALALAATVPLQLLAALALLVALWQVDLPAFLGLPQAVRWLRGAPEPEQPPTLFTGGAYAWVRHPLYFFGLVIIWLTPVMTVNVLAFNAGATLYLYIGALFEERKLVREYGDAYRAYQRRVPMLLPRRPAARV
jgi:protein-S-isoprenylcysteine O-methyltransferase Ste14